MVPFILELSSINSINSNVKIWGGVKEDRGGGQLPPNQALDPQLVKTKFGMKVSSKS